MFNINNSKSINMKDNFMTDVLRIQEEINTLQKKIKSLKNFQDKLVKYRTDKIKQHGTRI